MGPVVFLNQVGEPNHPYSVFQDVILEYLRHIIDYFTWYGPAKRGQSPLERFLKEMGFQTITLHIFFLRLLNSFPESCLFWLLYI